MSRTKDESSGEEFQPDPEDAGSGDDFFILIDHFEGKGQL